MPASRNLKWTLLASLAMHLALLAVIPVSPGVQRLQERLRTRVIATHVKLVHLPPPPRPQLKLKPTGERRLVRARPTSRRVVRRHRPRPHPMEEDPANPDKLTVAVAPLAPEPDTPPSPASATPNPEVATKPEPEPETPQLAALPPERNLPEERAGDPNAGAPAEVAAVPTPTIETKPTAPAFPNGEAPGPQATAPSALAALPRATPAPSGTVGQPGQPQGGGAGSPAPNPEASSATTPVALPASSPQPGGSPASLPGPATPTTLASLLPGTGSGPGAPGAGLQRSGLPGPGMVVGPTASPEGHGLGWPGDNAPRLGGLLSGTVEGPVGIGPGRGGGSGEVGGHSGGLGRLLALAGGGGTPGGGTGPGGSGGSLVGSRSTLSLGAPGGDGHTLGGDTGGPGTGSGSGSGDGLGSGPVGLAGHASGTGRGVGSGPGPGGGGSNGLPLGSGIGDGPGGGGGGPALARGSGLALTFPGLLTTGTPGQGTGGLGGGNGSGGGGGNGSGLGGPVGGLLGPGGGAGGTGGAVIVAGGSGLGGLGLGTGMGIGPGAGGGGGLAGGRTGLVLVPAAPGPGIGFGTGPGTGGTGGTAATGTGTGGPVTLGGPVLIAGTGGGGSFSGGIPLPLPVLGLSGVGGSGPGGSALGLQRPGTGGEAAPGGLYAGVAGSFDMPMGITNSDYEADAEGLPNLLAEVRKRTNVHVTITPRTVALKLDEIKQTPVIHLRGHKAFSFTPQEREALRQYVAQGGTILAEDSHGPFGECVQREMKLIFNKPLRDLPLSHEIYRTRYNLAGIPAGDMGERYPLQGVEVGGRLGVIFSRNDYGDCWEGTGAWVKPESREPAFQMGTNLFVYIIAHWNQRKQ